MVLTNKSPRPAKLGAMLRPNSIAIKVHVHHLMRHGLNNLKSVRHATFTEANLMGLASVYSVRHMSKSLNMELHFISNRHPPPTEGQGAMKECVCRSKDFRRETHLTTP